MEIGIIDAKKHLKSTSEYMCRYVKSTTENFTMHTHNYHELFLTLKGEGLHYVNGKEQKLIPGNLLFVRDFDVHKYTCLTEKNFEFINLSFSKETFNMLADYLGEDFPAGALLNAKIPPTVILSKRETEKLYFKLSELVTQEDSFFVKLKVRALLSEIFSTYFLKFSEEKSNIPLWLEITYEKMKKPENFIFGLERMRNISGKSREHLTRSLKQYYGTTPSEYITELRLNHSANLLISSNLSVTDVCYECGFENISWFYKKFVKKFNLTPKDYRKKFEKNSK